MEWLTQIGISASGLPWWAAFILILLTFAATKGMTAYLRWRTANLTERQYDDGQTKAGYEALVAELKEQVKELRGTVATVLTELKDVRTAHLKCEVSQAALQGQMDVMKEKIARLEVHDQKGQQHIEDLKKAVDEVTPG